MLQKLKDKIIRKLGGYTLKDVSKDAYVTAHETTVRTIKSGYRINAYYMRCGHKNEIIKLAKENVAQCIAQQLLEQGVIKCYIKQEYDSEHRMVGILHYLDFEDESEKESYGERV